MRNRWKQILVREVVAFLFCLTAPMASGLLAQEATNRTLLGNKAVQKELQLTEDQQKKIVEILAEMENAIAAELKAAEQNGEQVSPKQRSSITESLIEKYGNRASEVLDLNQKTRLWEIGAQSVGVGVFNNNRTQRVLQLTKDQLQKMRALHSQMAEKVTKAAVDPNLKISELMALKDRETEKLFADCRDLLTPNQQKSLDDLLGKPFDLNLLKNPEGKKPRSLTFVFDLSWRNAHSLFADPKLRQKCRFTPEQSEKTMTLFKQQDARVTAVRLGVLKDLPVDFLELDDEEKSKAARKILDGAHDIFHETDTIIAELLKPEQFDEFDRRLIQIIKIRAVGSERIAAKLELTDDQKRQFVEAEAEFEQKTAPLRVVRSTKEFDQKQEQKLKEQFESRITAALTPAQIEKLESLAKE